LTNPAAIEQLKAHLCEHGALGYKKATQSVQLTELEKFRLVPLVFGLMPKAAYLSRPADQPIKPLITSHLQALGITSDPLLLNVLKSICDQFWESRKDQYGRPMKQKYGMKDIRANQSAYRGLRARQRQRCSLCGLELAVSDETLDHVVPFRIIGDIPDGANWSILCSLCNSAKGNYLSSLQAVHAHNWVYSTEHAKFPIEDPSPETRFLLLAQAGGCTYPGCLITPRTGRLFIRKVQASGLAIADNLTVRCQSHR
jgi:5-methylcytosine-specific restriction endonuclease McrA